LQYNTHRRLEVLPATEQSMKTTKTRKLTARTPLGTFTRTSHRDYQYVVVSTWSDEYLEHICRDGIKAAKRNIAYYKTPKAAQVRDALNDRPIADSIRWQEEVLATFEAGLLDIAAFRKSYQNGAYEKPEVTWHQTDKNAARERDKRFSAKTDPRFGPSVRIYAQTIINTVEA
jgi:hypothetical protein